MNRTPQSAGPLLSRREMLEMTGLGFGAVALGGLLASQGLLAAESSGDERAFDLRARPAHFSPRAKSIIMLMQNGGPSQMELFDPKPELNKRAGQVHRDKVEMFQPGSESNKLLGCPFKFEKRGQCGMEISEALPHLAATADDLCLVRSMHT